MLHHFERNAALFESWTVNRYEREAEAYLLSISATLKDGSRLDLRDYLFTDRSRKYAYQWMENDGTLRRRWDNAPHWPDVETDPHHMHLPDRAHPVASTVTNLEELFTLLQKWFAEHPLAE